MEANYCIQCGEPLHLNAAGKRCFCRQCNLEHLMAHGSVVIDEGDSSLPNVPATPNESNNGNQPSGY